MIIYGKTIRLRGFTTKRKLEIQELQNLIGKHLADSSKTEDDLIRLIPNARYEQIVQALKTCCFKANNKRGLSSQVFFVFRG